MDQVKLLFALYALVKIGPRAVPTLSVALGDSSEDVRHTAAECLEVIAEVHGGQTAGEAVPYLRKALADESADVRGSAAKAIGKIGPSAGAAVPDLLVRIEQDADRIVRLYSVRSLGAIGYGTNDAISVLTKLLNDEDAKIRGAAAEALTEIQGESSPNDSKR